MMENDPVFYIGTNGYFWNVELGNYEFLKSTFCYGLNCIPTKDVEVQLPMSMNVTINLR